MEERRVTQVGTQKFTSNMQCTVPTYVASTEMLSLEPSVVNCFIQRIEKRAQERKLMTERRRSNVERGYSTLPPQYGKYEALQ